LSFPFPSRGAHNVEPNLLSANLIWLLHWMKVTPALSLAIWRRSGESRCTDASNAEGCHESVLGGPRKGKQESCGCAEVMRECVKSTIKWGSGQHSAQTQHLFGTMITNETSSLVDNLARTMTLTGQRSMILWPTGRATSANPCKLFWK
jgi:hypothetical protein